VLTTHPLLVLRSRKIRAILLPPCWAFGFVTWYLSSSSGGPRKLLPSDILHPCRLIVLTLLWKFPLAMPGSPMSTMTRETSSRERGNCGREMTRNFADSHTKCRDLLHASNLQHGTNGFTSPLKEGTLRIFCPEKRLRPGLNP
jgi:hypothetical protein